MNPRRAREGQFLVGSLAQVHHKFLEQCVSSVDVFWTEDFIHFLFGIALSTDKTRDYVCDVSENNCNAADIGMDLWKFGFPETFMHLCLGLFSSQRNSTQRLADLLDGVGTVLHHGAASMTVSMLVAGVVPPSRAVNSPCLILVMQHWLPLLSCVNKPLYLGGELVLECYFEWIILSGFPELYQMHWIAALGAGVMLFAHWLYLASARDV